MDKTVYFVGAGATRDTASNAPVNKDLLNKALKDFETTDEARCLMRFIDALFHSRENPPIDNQIWNLLDYIIQQKKSASEKFNYESIINLRKCLINLVIKEFQKSLADIGVNVYESFIGKIKDTRAAIISTNYDIMLDSPLSRVVGLNYGTKMRNMVSGGFDSRCNLKRPTQDGTGDILNRGRIPLLKIHGSLNWLYCSKCDEVDITADKGVLRTLSEDYYCHNPHCTNNYEPLLITPTMFKNYENRFIKETWDCAEKELIGAENLVFIGYALKEEDYQIRCLLMKALLNKKKPYKKITIIEKKAEGNEDAMYLSDVKKKYSDLYGDIQFDAIGFTKYVETL